jgi:hypothetical protein
MIADSGASVHMRRNTDGMFDLRDEKCVINYENSAHSKSAVVGKWAGCVMEKGIKKKVVLDQVTVVPGSACDLFFLTYI